MNSYNSNINLKQNITDNSLLTTSKTVVGAINELADSIVARFVPQTTITYAQGLLGLYNEIDWTYIDSTDIFQLVIYNPNTQINVTYLQSFNVSNGIVFSRTYTEATRVLVDTMGLGSSPSYTSAVITGDGLTFYNRESNNAGLNNFIFVKA